MKLEDYIDDILLNAQWKKDCQDKSDYDFNVITVTTRFYGRDNTSIPSINIGDKTFIKPNQYITGETESDCKQKTEKWIKDELTHLISLLINKCENKNHVHKLVNDMCNSNFLEERDNGQEIARYINILENK